MKPHHDFAPGQRAAMHAEALVARSAEPPGGLGTFRRFGQTLAPLVAARLPGLFAEGEWEASTGEPETLLARALGERIDLVAGNFLLPVGDAGGRLFASFRLPPVMERLEAMFGGDAAAQPVQLGARLPNSLVLLLHKLEGVLTGAVVACLDEAARRRGEQAAFATDFARLAVFPGQTDAVILPLRFNSERFAPLEVLLACRKSTLARLLVHFRGAAPAGERQPPEMLPAAMAEITVPLRARLAQMTIPASRLLALRPGQTLPLAIARSVPLMAGGRTLATGTVGEQDDRTALQIDRVHGAGGLL